MSETNSPDSHGEVDAAQHVLGRDARRRPANDLCRPSDLQAHRVASCVVDAPAQPHERAVERDADEADEHDRGDDRTRGCRRCRSPRRRTRCPMPPESISAATITIQAMPMESRRPVIDRRERVRDHHVADVGETPEAEHAGHVALVGRDRRRAGGRVEHDRPERGDEDHEHRRLRVSPSRRRARSGTTRAATLAAAAGRPGSAACHARRLPPDEQAERDPDERGEREARRTTRPSEIAELERRCPCRSGPASWNGLGHEVDELAPGVDRRRQVRCPPGDQRPEADETRRRPAAPKQHRRRRSRAARARRWTAVRTSGLAPRRARRSARVERRRSTTAAVSGVGDGHGRFASSVGLLRVERRAGRASP